MIHVHDPILLELVALHAAVSIPQRLRLITDRLRARLEDRESKLERMLEYCIAGSLACLAFSPVIYYGLSGMLLLAAL